LSGDGSVWAWGAGTPAFLGEQSPPVGAEPVQVVGLDDVRAISAGGAIALALRNDATTWGWGQSAHGMLGQGPGPHDRPCTGSVCWVVPAPIPAADHATAISAGMLWTWLIRTPDQGYSPQ
jgi:hypothetical protein